MTVSTMLLKLHVGVITSRPSVRMCLKIGQFETFVTYGIVCASEVVL